MKFFTKFLLKSVVEENGSDLLPTAEVAVQIMKGLHCTDCRKKLLLFEKAVQMHFNFSCICMLDRAECFQL